MNETYFSLVIIYHQTWFYYTPLDLRFRISEQHTLLVYKSSNKLLIAVLMFGTVKGWWKARSREPSVWFCTSVVQRRLPPIHSCILCTLERPRNLQPGDCSMSVSPATLECPSVPRLGSVLHSKCVTNILPKFSSFEGNDVEEYVPDTNSTCSKT